MNQDEFDASGVWSTLDVIKSQVENDLHPIDDTERGYVRSLHALVDYLDAFRSAPAPLWDQNALNQVFAPLEQVKNSLTMYLEDKNEHNGQFATAAGQVPQIVGLAKQFFPLLPPDASPATLKSETTRYRKSLDAELDRLRGEVASLEEQLEETKKAHDTTVAEFTTTADATRTRLEAVVEEFDTDREERLDAADAASEEARRTQSGAADEVLAQIRGHEQKAKDLLDATSRHAMSGGYGNWAAHQATAAFRWTIAAVVIAIAGIALITYLLVSVDKSSVGFITGKITVGLLTAGLFAYAAKQAAEHREQERTNKRIALDLAALEPFLEHAEEPVKLRDAVAQRLFVPEESAGGEAVNVRLGRRNTIPLAALVELLGKIAGRDVG